MLGMNEKTLTNAKVYFSAEREGFEPPDRSHGQWFSRPPHSTTLPSLLRMECKNNIIFKQSKIITTFCQKKLNNPSDCKSFHFSSLLTFYDYTFILNKTSQNPPKPSNRGGFINNPDVFINKFYFFYA